VNFIPTQLQGCCIIEPKLINDERGYFMESFNEKRFQEAIGQPTHFVQDNQSFSTKGVLRGLHYQTGIHAQAKLVTVIEGTVLDIAVDIRSDSATYGEHITIVLSSENKKQLFIPRGFAHGFLVLSDTAIFCYKCDNFYNKESEGGILYCDETLQIDWQYQSEDLIISEKDLGLPSFEKAKKAW
jgi:dTDP-4-dehydrorhamnose 3,5-epimerase